ncbi:MAG: hypothetical protein J1F16_03580 [Muribaculaceae bacterium]|nr:hypothetical protein [Muribaculaceae bacterium]
MKKLSYLFLASAAMMLASCSNEELVNSPETNGEEATVKVNLSVSQLATRAYGDGMTPKLLNWAVYEKTSSGLKLTGNYCLDDDPSSYEWLLTQEDPEQSIKDFYEYEDHIYYGNTYSMEFHLVKGRTYELLFWAGALPKFNVAEGKVIMSPYKLNFDQTGASMTVDYSGVTANDESMDAFYGIQEIIVSDNEQDIDVALRRPFAQVNLLTTHYEDAKNSGYEVTQSKVTVSKAYTKLDLFTGQVSDPQQNLELGYGQVSPDGEGFSWYELGYYNFLNMVYLLANKEQELVELSYTWKDDDDQEMELQVGSVPVQWNRRTNLYGSLLTGDQNVNIYIENDFDNEGNLYVGEEIAEGVTMTPDKERFYISNEEGLKWLADAFKTKNIKDDLKELICKEGFEDKKFYSKVVYLTSDLDLKDVDWTPIGNEADMFYGNFDGQGHTISNLTIEKETESNIGFFGVVSGYYTGYSNVNFKNVKLKGKSNVGVMAGKGIFEDRVAHINNCTIVGAVIEVVADQNDGGENAGSLIGHCVNGGVEQCDVKQAQLTGLKNVGGIVGNLDGADTGIWYCNIEDSSINDAWVASDVNPNSSSFGVFTGGLTNGATDQEWRYNTSKNVSINVNK